MEFWKSREGEGCFGQIEGLLTSLLTRQHISITFVLAYTCTHAHTASTRSQINNYTHTAYTPHKYCIHTSQILRKSWKHSITCTYQSGKHLSLVTNRIKAFKLEFCLEKVLLIPQWVLFDLLPDMRMIWTGKLPLTPSIALTVHQITGWHLSKCNN